MLNAFDYVRNVIFYKRFCIVHFDTKQLYVSSIFCNSVCAFDGCFVHRQCNGFLNFYDNWLPGIILVASNFYIIILNPGSAVDPFRNPLKVQHSFNASLSSLSHFINKSGCFIDKGIVTMKQLQVWKKIHNFIVEKQYGV